MRKHIYLQMSKRESLSLSLEVNIVFTNWWTTIHSTYIYNINVLKDQHIGAIFLPLCLLCAKHRDSNVPSGFPGEELSICITTLRFSEL